MLYYEVSGGGLPVVFLHGYTENLNLWDDLRLSLSDKYQVLVLDLPGFGKSPSLPTPFELTDIADVVHKFITKTLHIDKYVIFGHSLGGYISLAITEQYSSAVLALGLINSTCFADTMEKKENRTKTADFILKHGTATFLRSFVPNLFTQESQVKRKNEIARVTAMGADLPESTLCDFMMAMRDRPNRAHILEKLAHVLFVGGKEDLHIPLNDMEIQVNLLSNKQHGHIFDNVAHMSMFEAKDELIKAIVNFLQEVEIKGK